MPSSQLIVNRLREQGIRLTMQRRLVLEVLCQQSGHLLIPDIQQLLSQQGVPLNETTIYRILQWLKEAGIVSQTDLGQRGIVYQILGEEPHHHLVCLVCGAVFEIDNAIFAEVGKALQKQYGFEPRMDHMAIFGRCQHCQH